MMRIIVITSPGVVPGEVSFICRLLDSGVYRVHLRKPAAGKDVYERILREIPDAYRCKIVLHDHFCLCEKYHLAGVHLNSRSHVLPDGFSGSVSCSCHSLAEVTARKCEMDYLFLSPIFDSISKEGYPSAFTDDVLQRAAAQGIIDDKVMALGGVSCSHLATLQSLSFGGAAMLGEVWNPLTETHFGKVCEKIKVFSQC